MSEAIEYSKRLGKISDEQFAAATERLGVGTFVKAMPITSGLFGQNVFVTTSDGEFVLRGAPHWVDLSQEGPWNFQRNDLWQFSKEAFFARLLHEKTGAPVPWPQLLDKQSDIFGWPYIIMPRMPGVCLDDQAARRTLNEDQRRSAADALGSTLASLQKLEWSFAGDFDLSLQLAPYPGGHTQHVIRDTAKFTANARLNGSIDPEDDAWIRQVGETALVTPSGRPNVYLHGDFKLGNTTLSVATGAVAVAGVFDLHESRFGDGASDLCRQACSYLDFDPAMASSFIGGYRSRVPNDPTIERRIPLYIVNERMRLWEYFTRPPEVSPWLKGKTFRDWARRYVDGILRLLQA